MTWKGWSPVVTPLSTVYQTGVKLLQAEMQALEAQIRRLPTLEKWFVTIPGTVG